jgi:hypothetical protein
MTRENILAALKGLKTQTRRVVKPQPPDGYNRVSEYVMDPTLSARFENDSPPLGMWTKRSPYGSPGDSLVLTETWRPVRRLGNVARILYKADKVELVRSIPDMEDRERIDRAIKHGRWMPPMFMQAWASRAPAVNEGVRVERVQEITELDALAEGCRGPTTPGTLDGREGEYVVGPARDEFRALWDSINATRGYSWESNPWVWVVTFKLA